MLVEFFILCLCKGMALKRSLVSIPSGLPIPISSNHSTDFNINNKTSLLVLIHSIGELKVSVIGKAPEDCSCSLQRKVPMETCL